ncbi:MAG TPA: hypothetical protein VFY13_05245 [Luteolibacter sp.]|nr:hypothetical protein [Luteolibacter sp.]
MPMTMGMMGVGSWVRMVCFALCCFAGLLVSTPGIRAQDAQPAVKETLAGLEKALAATKDESSEVRQRLAVRRVIRDAEQLVAAHAQDDARYPALEFLFRARQQLVSLDKDAKHRAALLETCRDLAKAPDEFAALRLEADLLLSQADLAKQGASNAERAQALRPFVERYQNTPVELKVVKLAMGIALELGDSRLVSYLQEMIEARFGDNLEMVRFLRDKLGGQVIGAPFVGAFACSDGKVVRYPMEGLGRTTMLVFWTKNERGEALLKGIAATALQRKLETAGRFEIVTINLDDLPDAGESFVRSLGVDWKALRLPGGKSNPVYDAYARSAQRIVIMSPTGIAALLMPESGGGSAPSPVAVPDFTRSFQSFLAREWTYPRYLSQLTSLAIGEFLVIDPEAGIDPARPPELKAAAKGGEVQPLKRDSSCVPDEVLRAIQACFVAPPTRYNLPLVESGPKAHPVEEGYPLSQRFPRPETRANYAKAVELCRKAMADHASAPDLWIVRNRLIIALMGLWKCDSDVRHLEAAAIEAKAALNAGFPKGCEVIARLCIARGELLNPSAAPKDIARGFVSHVGGDDAVGAALAAAALLALDVGDRPGFENLRSRILKSHTEHPMMWTYSAYLLDRYHDYWLFQIPFTAGWTFDRRQGYFMTQGYADEARRMLRAELLTEEGKTLRIPEDLQQEWTMIVFAQPGPWSTKHEDGLPHSPAQTVRALHAFAATRPAGDVKVMLALYGGDLAAVRTSLLYGAKQLDYPLLTVPGGLDNPLLKRLGFLAPDERINSVLIRKDGWVAAFVSGLADQSGPRGMTLCNTVQLEDEKTVVALLERGEVQAAREKIMALAPHYDPDAVDAKGHKPPKPQFSTAHIRARARVYMALKDLEKARADAAEVAQRQLETDGWLSLRTPELDAAEALKAAILEQTGSKDGAAPAPEKP